ELMAPQETTTRSAAYDSDPPGRSTITAVTSRPVEFVSSLLTNAFVSNVTLGDLSASSTHSTWASDFPCTRHGKPSHVLQRIQRLACGCCSSSMTPIGT